MKFRFLLGLTVMTLGALSPLACSDPAPATPRTAISTRVSNGTHPAAMCMLGGISTWITVGAIGNTVGSAADAGVVPVNSGEQGVSVDCTVSPSGDGFQVTAQAKVDGAAGGTVSISGFFARAQPDVTNSPQMNVTALFQRNDTGQFNSSTCVMSYPNINMGVVAGRVWGQLDCPDLANVSQNRVCTGTGEIRFENCAQ